MSLAPLHFDHNCYRVNGQPVYLNSGEFHYFRVPKPDWRQRMELFKQAGGNCLATYVPWVIHEPQEGNFVFGTEPFNDLESFLVTANQAGLYVIARPGPYQYSELLYAGLPHWLCEEYSEILARDAGGQVINPYSVSYLHPLFLNKARRWFDRVCPILARYTVNQGGPIAFVQVDNELAGMHLWFSGPDYHPETMGFGQPDGRFTRFLRHRYGSLSALNQAYGMEKTSFEEVLPIAMQGSSSLPELRRRKDYIDFYLGTVAEYARTLADWLAEDGLDLPIIHNSGNPEMNALFKETNAVMGKNFILGSDHYYNLDQNWPQNNPTPQYARRVFTSLEMLRLMGFPPTVFEMPGGSASHWPPVTPEDARACYLTNLALGMKGHNYYIFTGGPNPPGTGANTDLYDYGAGIGANGEIRPLYQVQKEFGVFIQDHPWLAEARREADCRFTLDWQQARSYLYWQERGEFLLSSPQAWKFMQEGPLTTAFCAGLSPIFCDLESDDWTRDLGTPVVITASTAMPAVQQERIISFLQNGGKALVAPLLPEYDENWQPCSRLRDFLGVGRQYSSGKTPTRLNIAGVSNVNNSGQAFFWTAAPDGAEVIGTDERSGALVAWAVCFAGGGEAVLLGLQWLHGMSEHAWMFSSLLGRLGLKPKVKCSNPNVWTSLLTSGDHSMLFLLNLLSAPMTAEVACQPAWSAEMIDAGLHQLAPMTVSMIEIGNGTGYAI